VDYVLHGVNVFASVNCILRVDSTFVIQLLLTIALSRVWTVGTYAQVARDDTVTFV